MLFICNVMMVVAFAFITHNLRKQLNELCLGSSQFKSKFEALLTVTFGHYDPKSNIELMLSKKIQRLNILRFIIILGLFSFNL